MNKATFLSILLGCMTTVGVTSCLDDDNNNNSSTTLTAAERAQCYALVKGRHDGSVVYPATNPNNPADKSDTLSISWNITSDSTMVIEKFPAQLLTINLTEPNLKAALDEAPDQDINCFINFIPPVSPVQFLVYPYSMEYDLNYNGEDHKVQVAFYVNTTYSFGAYDATSNSHQLQIIEAAVYVDEELKSGYLSAATPFEFFTK